MAYNGIYEKRIEVIKYCIDRAVGFGVCLVWQKLANAKPRPFTAEIIAQLFLPTDFAKTHMEDDGSYAQAPKGGVHFFASPFHAQLSNSLPCRHESGD